MAELINRQNYESYLIDYIDGALTASLAAEVEAFLRRNPDIAQELDALADMRLAPPQAHFEAKERLRRRPEAELNHMPELDYLCVAELEGDIAHAEAQRLQLLAQQDRRVDAARRAYALTKLQPSPHVVFAHKDKLRRENRPALSRWLWAAAAATAASVALLVGVLSAPDGDMPAQMASSTPIVAPPPPAPPHAIEPLRGSAMNQHSEAVAAQTAAEQWQLNRPLQPPHRRPPRTHAETNAPLQRIEAQRVELPPYIAPIEPSHIAMASNIGLQPPPTAKLNEPQPSSPLSSIAPMALYRAGRLLGLKHSVRRDASNNITHVRLSGQHLAVTVPIRR
ncbi:MAG: hypothetical protein IJU72_07710 [Bacteroidales bacterium]|nr:hypothetical protein [Bacteroidales bacterium]